MSIEEKDTQNKPKQNDEPLILNPNHTESVVAVLNEQRLQKRKKADSSTTFNDDFLFKRRSLRVSCSPINIDKLTKKNFHRA